MQKYNKKMFTHNLPNGLLGIHNYVQSRVDQLFDLSLEFSVTS